MSLMGIELELSGKKVVFPETKPFCLVCGAKPVGTKQVWFEDHVDTVTESGAGKLGAGAGAIAERITFEAPLCGVHRKQARLLSLKTAGFSVLAMILAGGGATLGVTQKWPEPVIFGLAIVLGGWPGVMAGIYWVQKDRGGLTCKAHLEDDGTLVLKWNPKDSSPTLPDQEA